MNKTLQNKQPKEVVIKPEVRFGQPTVGNTRVTIADIINLLKAGYTVNDVPQQYPAVTNAATTAALEYTANILGKEEVLAISE